ncbi:hypothetical protein IQ260_01560 [Leptolyngbya cf. ectocarpi LEGE 11479]|uniref:Uncharacterized protein n=1 Tax=Leptolyngbya cf. ectocarpi LEGE 11479 TaxID=1828722 RepID=A0A928X2I1_LEPEC|nr:hypothetical protein [Leptolyngbya ectocarpi]MBE9065333.1 hypothetical protein [Leptolyngbya cf. ectocarpi LEGE 11479]
MLTQDNLFPENPTAGCMSASVPTDQIELARRCIKVFYQGLKWADRSGIHGGYVANRDFQRVFLMEDSHVLGVFDNRNSPSNTKVDTHNPSCTEEFIRYYQRGKGNIKTLIVLEKDNRRLANSETVGCQSKFLIDVIYPAIEGIRAKFSGDEYGRRWQKILSEAKYTTSFQDSHPGNILQTSLLSDIYHNPKKADERLAKNSPLKLFYTWNSPLNLEFRSEQDILSKLMPWEIDKDLRMFSTF